MSLLTHQWSGYPTFHRSRVNLLAHIVAVPALLVAHVALVVGLLQGSWIAAAVAAAVMALSLLVQGRGHRLEPTLPEPFTGAANATPRILAEQWITVPRYVLSGHWLHALRRRHAR